MTYIASNSFMQPCHHDYEKRTVNHEVGNQWGEQECGKKKENCNWEGKYDNYKMKELIFLF